MYLMQAQATEPQHLPVTVVVPVRRLGPGGTVLKPAGDLVNSGCPVMPGVVAAVSATGALLLPCCLGSIQSKIGELCLETLRVGEDCRYADWELSDCG